VKSLHRVGVRATRSGLTLTLPCLCFLFGRLPTGDVLLGLIYEVGRWALRKAIEEYLRWRTAGLAAVRIAVNVSPLQLRNRGFIAEIDQAIGIDAHAAGGLELELTESLIMEDVTHSIASLRAVRAMSVTIAAGRIPGGRYFRRCPYNSRFLL
jgi:hypothetical protein